LTKKDLRVAGNTPVASQTRNPRSRLAAQAIRAIVVVSGKRPGSTHAGLSPERNKDANLPSLIFSS
jgi:hypothetical protein